MSSLLLDEESVGDYLRQHLDSRDWWTLVWGRSGADTGQAIETRHYSGEAGTDFRLMIVPIFGMPCIAFAHKRQMSAKQLRRILARVMGLRLTEAQLLKQDIIFLADGPDDPVMLNAMAFLYQHRPDDGEVPA